MTDVVIALVLMAAGLALRLACASGYGLADDPILRTQIATILRAGQIIPDNQGYRIAWWLPTLLSVKVLGLNEIGLLAPVTTAATFGIGAVYALGKRLIGRAGGIIAALLVIALPFDVVWSTMFASDFLCSLVSAVVILMALRATSHPDRRSRRWAWAGAVLATVVAYNVKISGAYMVLPVFAILWMRRHDVGSELLTAVVVSIVCALAVGGAHYYVFGDPIAPLHLELRLQGLTEAEAAGHAVHPDIFWIYPNWMLRPSPTGQYLYAGYAHLTLAFLALGWAFGFRTPWIPLAWFVLLFLGLQLNVQHVGGYWVAGFRNLRHMHGLVYPLCLVLAAYLASVRDRWPGVGSALIATLLGFGLWQSIAAAQPTRTVFGDRRAATGFLMQQAPGPIHGDISTHVWWELRDITTPPWKYVEINGDPASRTAQLAEVREGYVVTGTGQEPYYGCMGCPIRASELDQDQFVLLLELPGPPPDDAPWWRPEPVRVWRAKGWEP